MSDPIATVQKAWGPDVPDWIMALAQACKQTSQRAVAKKIGRSGALVNQVLRGCYTGDMPAVEDRVRGMFMAATVECPELGNMPSNECQDWQAKARDFGAANPLRVRMYRACHRCSKFKGAA
ncbi:MAG: hypothetical protein ACWA40_07395 [Planktomarina sp.]